MNVEVKRYRYEYDYDYGWTFDDPPMLPGNDHPVDMVLASEHDALKAENERYRAALQDILEWCENAKRSVNIEPYGLAVARAALSKGE